MEKKQKDKRLTSRRRRVSKAVCKDSIGYFIAQVFTVRQYLLLKSACWHVQLDKWDRGQGVCVCVCVCV